jgi:ABC-type sugar transport system substrate-binding protein
MSAKSMFFWALIAGIAIITTNSSARAAGSFDCSKIKAAAVVHFQGPYTKEMLAGAETAAKECGAQFQGGGPAMFDTTAEVSNFQDFVLGGAKAIVVVAYPSDFWIRIIDDAVKKGVKVSTFDVPSPASLQSLHTAPKLQDLGSAMADVLADKLGAEAQGNIVAGICIPGLDVLEARVTGFKQRIAKRLPHVRVEGPFDVKFDQTENYSQWRSTVDAHPGGIAYVGFCENDLPSLVRIKAADKSAKYEIASIGVNPDGLKGIADGVALAAIGQKPFMQGYVAMRGMLQPMAEGKEVPRGWIDVGPEVITAKNVKAISEREESLAKGPEATRQFYAGEIDTIFSDLDKHVQSFGALLGN